MKCWCGSQGLDFFSPDYLVCRACQSLVSRRTAEIQPTRVLDDDRHFYGRNYWFSHQEVDLANPNILARARADVPERCSHWLRTMLKYRLPPANVLELGSGPGAFVALLNWAGFNAIGLEMSPWVVEFSSRAFGIQVLLGPAGFP
jgi:SAM-dependent methyltransferase